MTCLVWPKVVEMVICVPDRVALLAPCAQATELQLQLSSQDTPTASSGPTCTPCPDSSQNPRNTPRLCPLGAEFPQRCHYLSSHPNF